jgi:hypothetical protein
MKRWWALPVVVLMAVGAAWADDEEDVLAAVELPLVAKKAREEGLSAREVNLTLASLKGHDVKADDAARVLRSTSKALREFGTSPGLSDFVKAQLDAGLRGKKLSEAIAGELEAHGKGPKAGKGHGKPGGEPGKSGDEPGKHGRGEKEEGAADVDGARGQGGGPPDQDEPGAKGQGKPEGAGGGKRGKRGQGGQGGDDEAAGGEQ